MDCRLRNWLFGPAYLINSVPEAGLLAMVLRSIRSVK